MSETLTPVFRLEYFIVAAANGTPCDLEPIFNEEKYLHAIAGASVDLPMPIGRTQEYLAKLAGMDVEIPDHPIFRTEYYLAHMIDSTVECPAPVFREEMFYYEWASKEYVTIVGNPVTFSAIAAPLKQLEVAFSPIQSGSGDPSPDNIRPISGWTGVTVHRTGTNLNTIPNTMTQITCYDSGGGEITRWGYEIHLPAGTYTMKPTGFQENGKTYSYQRLCVVDANGFVSHTSFSGASGASYNQRTITLEDGQWMINYHGLATGSGYQVRSAHLVIVQGTKDITEDIPYEGDEYTISIGQTVYSGTLDVVTGVVTVTKRKIAITSADDVYAFSTNSLEYYRARYNNYGSWFKNHSAGIYSVGTVTTASNAYNFARPNTFFTGNTSVCVMPPSGVTTVQDYKAWLDSIGGVEAVVELKTPTTIQLTPQEVESLAGDNTMWTDGDSLTVEYRSN